MPPIISVVGRSKAGKTTLVEKLVAELKSRGYRIATIKHAQEIHFEPGKDSSRHLEAGSEATAIATTGQMVLIKPIKPDTGLDELARSFGDSYDLIITEGFKEGSAAKIEVHRQAAGPPLQNLTSLLAIVTDEPLPTRARQFSFDDICGLAALIEQGFILPQSERLSVYINDEPLALTLFPRKMIASLLLGMVNSLKNVDEVSSLNIWLKNPNKKN